MRTDIIDVSGNNGIVDMRAVAASGVLAVLAKATEGVGWVDSSCKTHCANAHAAALKVGVYHYLRVRRARAQDARVQARQYIAVWLREPCDLLPCLDVESAFNTHYGNGPLAGKPLPPDERCTDAEIAQAVCDFVDEVQQLTGFTCILYTSKGEWEAMGLVGLTHLSACPLWVAAYGSHATAPAPWLSFAAHQWQGPDGRCPGCVGAVDCSEASDFGAMLARE